MQYAMTEDEKVPKDCIFGDEEKSRNNMPVVYLKIGLTTVNVNTEYLKTRRFSRTKHDCFLWSNLSVVKSHWWTIYD